MYLNHVVNVHSGSGTQYRSLQKSMLYLAAQSQIRQNTPHPHDAELENPKDNTCIKYHLENNRLTNPYRYASEHHKQIDYKSLQPRRVSWSGFTIVYGLTRLIHLQGFNHPDVSEVFTVFYALPEM
ncbi:unnamed protein product [Schistosoma curassoni]|uniref:Transposase n=1 Tax=Schistosoma curassoni TaxID=6186 RepID=A0A183KZC5_9TREM|nr:unnamed protein product [Schistosoma curassoni]